MNINFEGKTALVTGAGKGIGQDITLALAEGGAKVYAVSRTLADLQALKTKNDRIEPVVCDLSNWDDTEKVIGALGPVDLLVNNAGTTSLENFVDVSKDEFQRVFDLNVRAVIQVSQIISRGMISRGSGGVIVNVSSQASMMALERHTLYCASKAALDSITKTMALELGPNKAPEKWLSSKIFLVSWTSPQLQVRVNACNPTVVLTEMGRKAWSDPKVGGPLLSRIPLGRFAEVEDVTHIVLYLLSDKSAMLNGVTLPVDGGFTIAGV